MPPKSGKDRDGLSVSIERRELVKQHRRAFESEKTRAAFLPVKTVRTIEINRIFLNAIWAPETFDPAHALVAGIPGNANPSNEERKIAERYADLLGQMARPHIFPE